MYENEITMKLKELPDVIKKEVLDYVNSLLAKEQTFSEKTKEFKFLWENGLKEESVNTGGDCD